MKRFFNLIWSALIIVSPFIYPAATKAASLDYLEIDFGNSNFILPFEHPVKYKFTVKNNSDASHNVSFTVRIKESDQDTVGWPQPQVLYFGANETLTIQSILDELWGKLDPDQVGDQTRTFVWTFEDMDTGAKKTVESPVKITSLADKDIVGDLNITGKVIGTDGNPASGIAVKIANGSWSKDTSADASGVFSFSNLPSRIDYYLMAGGVTGDNQGQPGGGGGNSACDPPPAPCPKAAGIISTASAAESGSQAVAYAFVDPSTTDYTLTLKAAIGVADYSVVKEIKSEIGFWRGDVDVAEENILLINGMENWRDQDKDSSKLYLYSIDGTKKWAYDMGSEGWGADLSSDGKYAAFVTSNMTENLGVVDAATGQAVWVKKSNQLDIKEKLLYPGPDGGIDSKEIEISDNNKYVAIGSGGGTVVVADLLTGQVLWTAEARGQVRGLIFDSSSEFLYAGSGDGNAYKIKTSDGSIVWKADIGSWPFTNGWKLSADGKFLGSASKVGEVTVIDTDTGEKMWQSDQTFNASWLDFSPDGKYVFAGGGGSGSNTMYEAVTGKKLWKIEGFSHQGQFMPDSKYVVVGDKNVVIYDLFGNKVGEITASDGAGQNDTGQGQFVYVTKDGSQIIYTRRDMNKEGIVAVFAKGKIISTASTDSTAAAPAEGKTGGLFNNPLVYGGIGLVIVLSLLIYLFFIRSRKQTSRE